MSEPTVKNDAAAFFQEMVEPTVAEFLERPHDRRRGCLACLCLASMVDHYFHAQPEDREGCADVGAFRKKAARANWAVGQVIGIANATKHVRRMRGRAGFEDVSAQPITFGNLRAGWPINGTQAMVEVEGGDIWLLTQLVEAAMAFWRERLSP